MSPLRALRQAKRWTQQQLSTASHVSGHTIGAIEVHGHIPHYHVQRRLLVALREPWESHETVFGVLRDPRKSPDPEADVRRHRWNMGYRP